jgi:Zn-dependent membrane protease YugP
MLLDKENLAHVTVEKTNRADHYDPIEKAVRLLPECFDACSLTAITVAAHEVGHALQDRDADPRLRVRTSLAVVLGKLQPLNVGFLLVGSVLATVLGNPRLIALIVIAALTIQLLSTVLNLITLPMEWNASFGRALPILQTHNILREGDQHHACRILRATALTYVAASLVSLLFLQRWVR